MFKRMMLTVVGMWMVSGAAFGAGITTCNFSNTTIYCSFAGYSAQANNDFSKGWWTIPNGQCQTATAQIGGFYSGFCQADDGRKWTGSGSGNDTQYNCVQQTAYLIYKSTDYATCQSLGGKMEPFKFFNSTNFTWNISP
jgi:uncharacterized membrane protein